MTSLGVPVRNIVDDLRDGLKLLQVLDAISPGCVDWKKVNMNPKNAYAQTENAQYSVNVGKSLNFSVVGIGGKDLIDGNRKLILGARPCFLSDRVAMVWQMMKLHVFEILSRVNKKFADRKSDATDDLLQWANDKVKKSGKDSQMKDFKDSSLSTGRFLIDLLNAVRPRVVDYSLVTTGSTG